MTDTQNAVARIFDKALADKRAHERLSALCDDIGPRLSGSESLDQALEWAKKTMKDDGHENVAIEPVTVPKWVRGEESLRLLVPYGQDLRMLGLGGSVGTGPEGITADVVVVDDKEGLEALADADVKGKIVLFNTKMPPFDPATNATGYGQTVRSRTGGARWAAKKGAVAVLVRSVTARSLDTPHTGTMGGYGGATRKIPAAAITIEAAEQMARLHTRGKKIAVKLVMGSKNEGTALSGNVVAELRGREKPDEIVVIGGHIDSWDIGQGARDNGSGVVIAMHALTTLRELGLKPRRTIRVVLWTNEENGLEGAKQYAATHKAELDKHIAGIESDSGGAKVRGFNIQFPDKAVEKTIVETLAPYATLFEPIGATEFVAGFSGADLTPLRAAGMPGLGLRHDLATYFDIHHTAADTIDKISVEEMQQGTAAMAAMAWLLADRPESIRPGAAPAKP